jgi:hypothetical protein
VAQKKWTEEEIRAWKEAREREKTHGMLGRLLRMLLLGAFFNRNKGV